MCMDVHTFVNVHEDDHGGKKRTLDQTLELELQELVSYPNGCCRESNSGPLQEQQEFLRSELSLKLLIGSL